MNRRTLLSMLAGVPFVGTWLAPAKAVGLRIGSLDTAYIGDGVALTSRAHPYAVEGETVTCENGHQICDFIQTVDYGQMQDLPSQLGNWRQEPVVVGTPPPFPGCAVCGAPFSTGSHFHIGKHWRAGDEPAFSDPTTPWFDIDTPVAVVIEKGRYPHMEFRS